MEGANISGADPNHRAQLFGCNLRVLRFLSRGWDRGWRGWTGGTGGVVTLRGRTGSETVVNAVRTRVMRRNQSGEPVT